MVIPDLNLLVYAYDTGSPLQERAAAWWSECLSGAETVGLPLPVVFGFMRVSTVARTFQVPLTPAEAAGHVRDWLARRVTTVLVAPPDHVDQVLRLLEAAGTAGNLTTDAQLAALALHFDAVVHTADADFLRFPGLRWLNPLTGQTGG